MKFYFILALLFLSAVISGQNQKLDSLRSLLVKDSPDTNKAVHLNKIASIYSRTGILDSALFYGKQAAELSQKLNFSKGTSGAFETIGNAYADQGDYVKALEYQFKALKTRETASDKIKIPYSYSSIGTIYLQSLNYDKALEYYFKALQLSRENGTKGLTAALLGNIGLVHYQQENYTEALKYELQALAIKQELADKKGVANWLGNIGLIYERQGEYAKALDCYYKALTTAEELEDNMSIARHLANIGSLYTRQHNYRNASDFLFRALRISNEMDAKDYTKEIYLSLSDLYNKSNILLPDSGGHQMQSLEKMRMTALEYYKQYISIRDTLFSTENKKQMMQKEMSFEFEKREITARAQQEKLNALNLAEKKKQQIIIYSVAGLLLVTLLFALLMYNRLRLTNRQKIIIEKQKIKVDRAYEELNEKNKEVMDSISYASRIQQALITSEKYISTHLRKLTNSSDARLGH